MVETLTDPFDPAEGATPLNVSEIEGLIPTWVTFRSDLNQVELENVTEAIVWASMRRWVIDAFDQRWVKELHRRMFENVWRSAGIYRHTDANLGIAWQEIPTAVETVLLDLKAQTVDASSVPWSPREIAVRFHYRLVTIHPFLNGNGRHARLAADLVLSALGGGPLSWGDPGLADAGPVRSEYLAALREVDETGDFGRLLRFAR